MLGVSKHNYKPSAEKFQMAVDLAPQHREDYAALLEQLTTSCNLAEVSSLLVALLLQVELFQEPETLLINHIGFWIVKTAIFSLSSLFWTGNS